MSYVDRFVSREGLQLADAGIDREIVQADGDAQAAPFGRADLLFYGVAHSRGSYEGRVFLNNPDADRDTPRDAAHRYAGSFWVFGHDHCYGDPGHCDPDWGAGEDAIDYRRPHHMEPLTERVEVTGALHALGDLADPVVVTVVAVRASGPVEDDREPMRFEHIRLVTYE
ncbi:MAG: hypothetical protein M3296_05125 [Actinomycetota bacterium]|nr:hypothetical protein [Actinomycetota bacterium]